MGSEQSCFKHKLRALTFQGSKYSKQRNFGSFPFEAQSLFVKGHKRVLRGVQNSVVGSSY